MIALCFDVVCLILRDCSLAFRPSRCPNLLSPMYLLVLFLRLLFSQAVDVVDRAAVVAE